MANKWIRRKRNSMGYGVQSPSDFHFVRHVLREKLPYYAYSALEDMVANHDAQAPCYPIAIHKLLFRLANHVHPDTIIEVGGGASIFAMAMACPLAQCTLITSEAEHVSTLRSLQATQPKVEVKNGDEIAVFSQFLRCQQSIGILHVGHTPHYRELVDAALPYASNHTLFIIEGIRESKEKRNWWESLQESPSTGISYDLNSVGLLFFDRTRHKSAYWINLRD